MGIFCKKHRLFHKWKTTTLFKSLKIILEEHRTSVRVLVQQFDILRQLDKFQYIDEIPKVMKTAQSHIKGLEIKGENFKIVQRARYNI